MNTNKKVTWEGNYIHTQNGKHGRVISNDSTTMNVKWYSAWQWFFIGNWLAFWQWAAQQSVQRIAFGAFTAGFLVGVVVLLIIVFVQIGVR